MEMKCNNFAEKEQVRNTLLSHVKHLFQIGTGQIKNKENGLRILEWFELKTQNEKDKKFHMWTKGPENENHLATNTI